jgi:hypothetical protein
MSFMGRIFVLNAKINYVAVLYFDEVPVRDLVDPRP